MYFELDRNLTERQKLLKETVHEFAKKVIRPASVAIDQMMNSEEIIKRDSVFWDAKRKARQAGYHIAGLPKALGGFEAGPLEFHILLEEFGWGSPGLGLSILTDSFPATAVLMYQPENKRLINDIVIPLVKDLDVKTGSCWAITEPDHGSDVAFCFTRHFPDPKLAFSTRAILRGDEWIINGQKSGWISNGPVATQALTWLTIFDSKGVVGGGIAIIPLDLPGVTRGKPTELIGMQDFPQCEIFFNDVRIPKDYMLIGPELYENAFSQFLNMTGLAVGTVFTGLARAAFEEALAYSKRRVQGGKPIAEHQIIKLKLFDMFTKVEASRALSRAVAKYCLTATDTIPVEYSTVAKVYCSQVAFEVANEAVQIHGAYGYTKDALVGKLLRDARVASIMDGCNEVISLKDSYRLIERYNPLE